MFLARLFSLALLVSACSSDGAAAPLASASGPASAPATAAPTAVATSASAAAPAAPPEPTWLERSLVESDPRFTEWLSAAKDLRLQVLVTEVDPSATTWRTHELRVDAEYFYPASAIKTLLAIGALGILDAKVGGRVSLASRIERCRPNRPRCEPPDADVDEDAKKEDPDAKPKHEKLRLGEEIAKLLSYSDNDSYNRLWDLVGHEDLNREVAELGFSSVRFHHRMDSPADRSRTTMRTFLLPPGKKALDMPSRTSKLELAPTPATDLAIGTAYLDKGKKVTGPMAFDTKNYVSLRDLQLVNLSLFRPDRPEAKDLRLSEDERALLTKAMTAALSTPGASDHHPISGGVLEVRKAAGVRILGKSGRAYGFHIDNSLVLDKATEKGFFVTATVYANPNGVLNDDDYGYKETTRPLLRALGKALAERLLPPEPAP